MKKYIYSILVGGLIFTMAACSEDWEDATSKHKYGEKENPYLRTDAAATATEKIQFGAGQTHTINLADYAEMFEEQLDMTLDEALAGMSGGTIVFHNINLARNAWDKTAPNKGTSGWYFDAIGNVVKEEDAHFTLELNTTNKTLVVTALETVIVGSSTNINVGFAINGPDFDKYVRFLSDIVIVDVPIEVSVEVPVGEYSAASIKFSDYADEIQERFGMTVTEFCAALDGNGSGTIHMYSVGVETLKWDETSSYTANAPGYWMKADGTVTSWGADGYSLFAECNRTNETLNIGRSFAPAAGDKFTISIGFRDTTNTANLIRFLIYIEML